MNALTGIKLDYSKHFRLPFGSYVKVHDKPSPTNSPTARTVGAITLGPTGNLEGGYKFLNLRTGKNVTRRSWTHLPMPSEVIERVNKIGFAQGKPKLLTFQDLHGHENSDPDPYFQPLDHEIEGVADDVPVDENFIDDHEDTNDNPADQGEEDQGEEVNEVDNPPGNENEVPTLADEAEIEELPDALAAQAVPETQEEPKRRSGQIPAPVTRFEPSFTGKKYADTTATTTHKTTIHSDTHMSLNEVQAWDHVVHYTMTQLSIKAGLKRWGNKGKQAVSKELSQLHMRDTPPPINSKTLSKTEYDKVLE